MTTEDQKYFREWLQEILRAGEATVIFEKKDGTQRKMRCTTCADLIPQQPLIEGVEPRERRVNPDVMPVYDLDLAAWRSFRWDSVQAIHLGLD